MTICVRIWSICSHKIKVPILPGVLMPVLTTKTRKENSKCRNISFTLKMNPPLCFISDFEEFVPMKAQWLSLHIGYPQRPPSQCNVKGQGDPWYIVHTIHVITCTSKMHAIKICIVLLMRKPSQTRNLKHCMYWICSIPFAIKRNKTVALYTCMHPKPLIISPLLLYIQQAQAKPSDISIYC